MKIFIYFLLYIGFINLSNAQDLYKVKYLYIEDIPEKLTQLGFSIEEKERTRTFVLIGDKNESVFKFSEDEIGRIYSGSYNIHFKNGDNPIFYRNFNENIELFNPTLDKKYIVENEIESIPWELKEETKIIEGIKCKKAVYTKNERVEIEAWYTESIPLSYGPFEYWGLPGLILELNEGRKHTQAISIKSLDRKEIEGIKPKFKGTKIGIDEYKKKRSTLIPF